MADILIRGMEMPHGCDSCKLNANGRGCSITGTKYESDTMVLMDFDEHTQRLKDCPIIELPEHGDLIDRDALCDGLVSNHPVVIYASNEPVVITSNKEDDE